MLIEFVKPDFVFNNDAGQLNQLVHEGWKQVNAIFSAKGSIRGGHYHKYNKECFFILEGSFKLIVWKDKEKEEYEIKKGDMFIIPEYVFHSFEYHEDTYLVAMYNDGGVLPALPAICVSEASSKTEESA